MYRNPHWRASAWNPWMEFQRLENDLHRFFETTETTRAREFPPIELESGAAGLRFTAQLPGFEAKDIDVSVEGDTLTLRATRAPDARTSAPATDSNATVARRRERTHGQFVRTVQLPHAVDVERVQATFANGLLEVELPRAESDKPRRIAIQAG
jgi:HSP20 family protein